MDFAAQGVVDEKLRRKESDGAAGRRGGMVGIAGGSIDDNGLFRERRS